MGAGASASPDGASVEAVGKEAFVHGIQRVLELAIHGFPRALRSTLSRRNALLREHEGDVEAAVAASMATTPSDQVKEFLLSMVPYVGMPATIIVPMWRACGLCLLSSVRGPTSWRGRQRVRLLYAFGGVNVANAGEAALGAAAQAVWTKLAGPLAGTVVPVGALVQSLAECAVAAQQAGLVDFADGARAVPRDEYADELDAERAAPSGSRSRPTSRPTAPSGARGRCARASPRQSRSTARARRAGAAASAAAGAAARPRAPRSARADSSSTAAHRCSA